MARSKANSSSNKSTSSKKSTVKATSIKQTSTISKLKAFHKSFKSIPVIGIVIAEFIGTFLITVSFLEMQGSPLFFAFALIGTILIVGGVSGAHLNPAVTIGALVTRKISAVNAFFYIVAQVLGSVVAWLVLNAFLQNSAATSTTTSVFHAATIVTDKEWYLFFAELLGVTILSLGVATAIRLKGNKVVASMATGFAALIALYLTLSITTVLLTESGTTFTFLNPAIAFASQGLSWSIWPIAIYLVAPIIGGIAGFILQDYLQSQNSNCCGCECDDCDCDSCKL